MGDASNSEHSVKAAIDILQTVMSDTLTEQVSKRQCLEGMRADRESTEARLAELKNSISKLENETRGTVLAISDLVLKLKTEKIVEQKLRTLVESGVKVFNIRATVARLMGQLVLECMPVRELKDAEFVLKTAIQKFPSDRRIGTECRPLFVDTSKLTDHHSRTKGSWMNGKSFFCESGDYFVVDLD